MLRIPELVKNVCGSNVNSKELDREVERPKSVCQTARQQLNTLSIWQSQARETSAMNDTVSKRQ